MSKLVWTWVNNIVDKNGRIEMSIHLKKIQVNDCNLYESW